VARLGDILNTPTEHPASRLALPDIKGDIAFEPDLQRTISVDIRYVLFTIDKWGKCSRLIDEMTIK